MMELMQENWLLFVAALLIGIAVAYWVFIVARRTSVTTDTKDALDDGAAPAARNQALIDAPPASVEVPAAVPAVPPGLAGASSATNDTPDDLSRIKGVGPKLKALLISLGVTRFSQIAAWSDEDIDRIDAELGRFQGRIRRDNWTEQASLLAGGDKAGYEDKFGKL